MFGKTRCLECIRTKLLNSTLKSLRRQNYPHWNRVRTHAKKVLIRAGVVKKCIKCEDDRFSEIVEACHIRDITKFPDTALIREVNDLKNLIYLCPSHHVLFDRGLISI